MFVADFASRLAHPVQITSDGQGAYLNAVENAFGWEIDYAVLVKIYGGNGGQPAKRYSPGECVGCNKHRITGNPDPAHVSTSYAESANLSMRMHMRRFTRLTNAFSQKLENHAHAIASHFMWYKLWPALRDDPKHASDAGRRHRSQMVGRRNCRFARFCTAEIVQTDPVPDSGLWTLDFPIRPAIRYACQMRSTKLTCGAGR